MTVRDGCYAFVDGRAADVFRFYKDGTYLFVTINHGATQPPITPADLAPLKTWFTRETYPRPNDAGQRVGTYAVDGKTVTLSRVPYWGDRTIEYRGTVAKDSITFTTLDHNTGNRTTETFVRLA